MEHETEANIYLASPPCARPTEREGHVDYIVVSQRTRLCTARRGVFSDRYICVVCVYYVCTLLSLITSPELQLYHFRIRAYTLVHLHEDVKKHLAMNFRDTFVSIKKSMIENCATFLLKMKRSFTYLATYSFL